MKGKDGQHTEVGSRLHVTTTDSRTGQTSLRDGGGHAMKGKRRTPLPRSPSRKRKPRTKPVSPRAKWKVERLRGAASGGDAVSAGRRQLPLDRGEAHRGPGQRVCRRERDQRRASHEAVAARLETHGLGRRDRGVGGTSARDGDAARGPDGARERPVGSGVLEGAVAVREWQRAGWPTGYRDDGTALPFRCRVRVPQRAGVEVRGARFVRGVAFGSESVPRSLGVGHSACSASSKPRPTDTFGRPRVRRSRRPSSERPCGRFSSSRPA